MRLLRRLYDRLRLKVNEAKSTIASVFRRKFLGYSFWVAPGGKIKRRVATKAMAAFKQRVRELTRRSGGRSLNEVVKNCVFMCWAGRLTSGWRILPESGAIWTSGYATGCEPSNSSSGNAARQPIANCGSGEHRPM
jgi:hypothetical protein